MITVSIALGITTGGQSNTVATTQRGDQLKGR